MIFIIKHAKYGKPSYEKTFESLEDLKRWQQLEINEAIIIDFRWNANEIMIYDDYVE